MIYEDEDLEGHFEQAVYEIEIFGKQVVQNAQKSGVDEARERWAEVVVTAFTWGLARTIHRRVGGGSAVQRLVAAEAGAELVDHIDRILKHVERKAEEESDTSADKPPA